MSREAFKEIVDKWMNDPQFRSEVRKDPEGAVSRTGESFTAEEKMALKKIDWSLSDEELKTRVNKIP